MAGKTITYAYDSAGRRSGISVTGGDSVTYGYSGLQLTSVTNATASRTASFTGDALPNGIPRNMAYGALAVAKTPNGDGQLSSVASTANGLSRTYSYGYLGGRRETISWDGKQWTLGYGAEGQLETAVLAQGATEIYDFAYAANAVGNPTASMGVSR